ncbi:hypothetical protein PIB30_071284 [Stylosanthes scabra]|uniref:Uncharacterized protein n=1 Tax=Stylosanthes scabra TaxID=79078 RepID=A0ABU6XMJ7_9FABA|nr:hypothetical protein [Stylosanthes scabra]
MGCQVSMFEIRRCAFDDKPYGVAESYSREGVDMERLVRNIAPTRELELFGPSLRVMDLFWASSEGFCQPSSYETHVKRVSASYTPAATCPFGIQALRGDVSFFLADVAEGNHDFSLEGAVFEISVTVPSFTCLLSSLRRV